MSHDNVRLNEAIKDARSRVSLAALGRHYGWEPNARGYTRTCPFCGAKGNKFYLGKIWGCYKDTCEANINEVKGKSLGDQIGLVQFKEGLNNKIDAIRAFLAIANVPFPENDPPKTKSPAAKDKPTPPKTKIPGDTPPPPDPPPTERTGGDDPNPWHEVWSRLFLTEKDRKRLREQRGLSNELITRLGFKSSEKNNARLLEPVLEMFPPETLLELGICVIPKGKTTPEFNSQLLGQGIAKRGKGREPDEWGYTRPILIPYWDADGIIRHLRPHKGGISAKAFLASKKLANAFRHTQANAHVYCPELLKDRPKRFAKHCVITEGEFKAAALVQCGIPAIAVPGIYMTRNEPFLKELVSVLRLAGVEKVTVIFDNEDKSHIQDPWKRHDVEVYARYACHVLRQAGFYAYYGQIPEQHRVEGKADWDGLLIKTLGKHRRKKDYDAANKLFNRIIADGKFYDPQEELFEPGESERIIHCKLLRLTYEPAILTGGDIEERDAKTIRKTPKKWATTLGTYALASELLATKGCYYIRKRPNKDDREELFDARSAIFDEMDKVKGLAERAALNAALRAVDILIEGRPEIISDFTIRCEYNIRNRDGIIHRLFQLHNIRGEVSALVQPDNKSLSTSSQFRAFCYDCGNFNFYGGDKQLQLLIKDLSVFSAWREIRELERLGHDPDSGLWIYGDCAFTHDGTPIFADDHDIIWHEGVGYRIDPDDLKHFAHETPPVFFQHPKGLAPAGYCASIDWEQERAETCDILNEFTALFHDSFGDMSGILAIGTMFAYFLAPETIKKFNCQPGLWIHGRMSGGKTETAKFLMQIHGFPANYRSTSLSQGTTAVGLDRTLSQYCAIPLHCDEFREDEVDKTKLASLRNAFNRQRKTKGRMDQTNRTRSSDPMTMPLVTGEGSTNDAATKSRFIQVVISASKRLPRDDKDQQIANYNRLLELAPALHRIGRYILRHRNQFSDIGFDLLNSWTEDPDIAVAIPNDRLRLTYGCAWSAFTAASLILQHPKADTMKAALRTFTMTYAAAALTEVANVNFVTKFWNDIVTGSQRNHTFANFFCVEYITIDNESGKITIIGTPDAPQPDGSVPAVICHASPLYAEYQQDKRTRGEIPELSLTNLSSEIKREDYWVPAPTKGCRAHRIKLKDKRVPCWVLRVDLMEDSLQELFLPLFSQDDDPPENPVDLPL